MNNNIVAYILLVSISLIIHFSKVLVEVTYDLTYGLVPLSSISSFIDIVLFEIRNISNLSFSHHLPTTILFSRVRICMNFIISKVLVEIKNTSDLSSSFFGDEGHHNLVASLMDLFAAGSETTSTTLTWAVLYMVREPAVQDRVQGGKMGFELFRSISSRILLFSGYVGKIY